MVKCPNCGNEVVRQEKNWKYGRFMVEVYKCNKCTTVFREYSRNGKHSFTLKRQKGRGFIKA